MAAPDIPAGDHLINPVAERALSKGEYNFICADGTETVHQGKAISTEIRHLIGCDALDTARVGPRRELTMLVDGTGMLDGKPVNAKATALYHAVCKPQTVWAIHGDVVIVPAGGLA